MERERKRERVCVCVCEVYCRSKGLLWAEVVKGEERRALFIGTRDGLPRK